MMKRSARLVFLALAGSLLVVRSAHAISNGQIDGTRHPNVGVVGCRIDGPEVALVTTAQLISPTVVLTAGHATSFFTSPGSGCRSYFASFDPTFTFDPRTSTFLEATAVITHPNFDPLSLTDDIGVFLLKKPLKGIAPVELPTAGLLDRLKLAGTLQGSTFTTVGYGADADCGAGSCSYSFDCVRKFAQESFGGLAADFLNIQMNATATGLGGTCYGDSGGPHFLNGTDLSVAVTSFANPFQGPNACRAMGGMQRLDIPSITSFLGRFVTLP